MDRRPRNESPDEVTRSGLARLGGGLVGAIAGVPFGIAAAFFTPFQIFGSNSDCEGLAGWGCLVGGGIDLLVNLVACVPIAMTVGGIVGWWLGKRVARNKTDLTSHSSDSHTG